MFFCFFDFHSSNSTFPVGQCKVKSFKRLVHGCSLGEAYLEQREQKVILAEVQYHQHAGTIALADQMSWGGDDFPIQKPGEAYILSPAIETDLIDSHRPGTRVS